MAKSELPRVPDPFKGSEIEADEIAAELCNNWNSWGELSDLLDEIKGLAKIAGGYDRLNAITAKISNLVDLDNFGLAMDLINGAGGMEKLASIAQVAFEGEEDEEDE